MVSISPLHRLALATCSPSITLEVTQRAVSTICRANHMSSKALRRFSPMHNTLLSHTTHASLCTWFRSSRHSMSSVWPFGAGGAAKKPYSKALNCVGWAACSCCSSWARSSFPAFSCCCSCCSSCSCSASRGTAAGSASASSCAADHPIRQGTASETQRLQQRN